MEIQQVNLFHAILVSNFLSSKSVFLVRFDKFTCTSFFSSTFSVTINWHNHIFNLLYTYKSEGELWWILTDCHVLLSTITFEVITFILIFPMWHFFSLFLDWFCLFISSLYLDFIHDGIYELKGFSLFYL